MFFKEGIIHEDNLWSFQSFHLAQKVVTIPEKTYLYYIRAGSIMTESSYERSLESAVAIYDEVLYDINSSRYSLISDESMNYLKRMINLKCLDLLLHDYRERGNRKNRLQILNDIPDSTVQIIKKHWSPTSCTTQLLKQLFFLKCYSLFDIIVILSMKKKDVLSMLR